MQSTLSANTQNQDVERAINELSTQLGTGAAFILLFFAPSYCAKTIAIAAKACFGSTPVYGCSTAGEIGQKGLTNDGITAIAFKNADFSVEALPLPNLSDMSIGAAQSQIADHFRPLLQHPSLSHPHRFALLLIDGLSFKEEQLVSAISSALNDLPLLGGSAGDGLALEETFLLFDHQAMSNAAILLVVETRVPFEVFKCDHFRPTQHKLVVTKADPEARIVYELNTLPAAEIYAQALNLEVRDLGEIVFANNPLTVRVGDEYYARSIKSIDALNSFTFYCAIDEGIVFTLSQAGDMVEGVRNTFADLTKKVGRPQLILGFDCILRKLVAEANQTNRALEKLYTDNNVVGFNTYGEQVNGVHLNQTFSAIAFGSL